MSNVFSPRIGKDYARGRIFGKKILALGESHYCGSGCADCGECGKHPECSDFTTNVVNWCLDSSVEREGWMNTYLKFERSLVGKETTPLAGDTLRTDWKGTSLGAYSNQQCKTNNT